MTRFLRLLFAAAALGAPPALGQAPIPRFEPYVMDAAGVISAPRKMQMTQELRAFEQRTGHQVVALVVASTQPEVIGQYARRAIDTWRSEGRKPGKGAILFVAISARAARIEAGDSLKEVLSDAATRQIASALVAPGLAAGTFEDSIEFGLRAIMQAIDAGPGATSTVATIRARRPDDEQATLDRIVFWAALIGVLLFVSRVGMSVIEAWRRRSRTVEPVAQATQAPEAPLPAWYAPSSLMIVAVNLVPLWAVLVQKMPVFELFVLFWFESLILILINALRILCARPGDAALWFRKIILVPGSCFAPIYFALGHAVAIFAIFARADYERMSAMAWPLDEAERIFAGMELWEPLGVITALHVLTFAGGYLLTGKYRTADVDELAARPFVRTALLHATLIFGGIAIGFSGAPLAAMLILVVLKASGELLAHIGQLKWSSR